jgi:hypothetical protein
MANKKSKAEKKAYHKQYYRDNIDRLQALARIRYWALVYKLKEPPVRKQERKREEGVKIIKGDFTLLFN